MSLLSALSRWLSVLLLAVITVPALARPADTASIERLLKATHMQQAYEAALLALAEQKSQRGGLFVEISPTPEQRARIEQAKAALRDARSWPGIQPAFASACRLTLSRDEADAIAAYYESEDGQRALARSMPPAGDPGTDIWTLPLRVVADYYAGVGQGRQDKTGLLQENLQNEVERRRGPFQDRLVVELKSALMSPAQ